MPYNPGNWNVYAQGLAGLGAGIDSGASGVAQGLKDWSTKKDLTKSLRGMFEAVDPDNADMYESMGLPDLQGKLQSYSLQHTLAVLKQQKQAMDEDSAFGVAKDRFLNGVPAAPPEPGPGAIGGIDDGGFPAAPAPGPGAMGGIDDGSNPAPAPAPAARMIPVPFGAPVIMPPDSGDGGGGDSGSAASISAPAPAPGAPGSLSASLHAYSPPQSTADRMRYALATPGLGGAGAMRLMELLKQYRAMNPEAVNVGPGLRTKSVKVAPEGTTTEYTSEPEVPPAGSPARNVPGAKGKMVPDGKEWKYEPEAGGDFPAFKEVHVVPGVATIIGLGKNTPPHIIPVANNTKATEAEAEAAQYANRMDYNNAVIEKMVNEGFDPSSRSHLITDRLPNAMKPADDQAYEAAKSNWVTAALRKETKRELSKEGMEKAERQYFPQPGDAPAVVQQKAVLRKMAARDVRAAGPAAGDQGTAPALPDVAPGLAPKFASEAQAKAAGMRPGPKGDVFLLYDPKTASYRRARLLQ